MASVPSSTVQNLGIQDWMAYLAPGGLFIYSAYLVADHGTLSQFSVGNPIRRNFGADLGVYCWSPSNVGVAGNLESRAPSPGKSRCLFAVELRSENSPWQ